MLLALEIFYRYLLVWPFQEIVDVHADQVPFAVPRLINGTVLANMF